jgi:hypothetical protein
VVGTDSALSIATFPRHEVASFCSVKVAEMTFGINLYELTALFEHCSLETTNGNSGSFFKIFIQKMYLMVW